MGVPGHKAVHFYVQERLHQQITKAKGRVPLDEWFIEAARLRLAGESAPDRVVQEAHRDPDPAHVASRGVQPSPAAARSAAAVDVARSVSETGTNAPLPTTPTADEILRAMGDPDFQTGIPLAASAVLTGTAGVTAACE